MRTSFKNRLLTFSIIIPLIFSLFQSNIYAVQSYPYIAGKSGLAFEYNTGTIIYEKGMNERIYPASTTKMLTALVVREKLDLTASITAPSNFPKVGGTSINITPGETFTVEQLLHGMIVRSGNDVATLLAMASAGSEQQFAELMNAKAKSLSCVSSNFTNASGLHDVNHYSTALDMSKITSAFYSDPVLREISGKAEYTIPATNKKPARVLTNTNKFLTGQNIQIENNGVNIPVIYPIVDGIKTGTTPEAGNCLVATAPKENLRIISLVFGSTEASVYSDSRYLLDYGLDNYKLTQVIAPNGVVQTYQKPLTHPKNVNFIVKEGYSYVEPIANSGKIIGEPSFKKIKLPLKADQQVGVYKIKNLETKQTLREIPIYVATDYESKFTWAYMGKTFLGKILRLFILLILIVVILFISLWGIRQHNIRKRRIRKSKRRNKH